MHKAMTSSCVREETVKQWITQYGDAVLHICFVYLLDASLAEDAMQDTFVKAWSHMDRFEARNGSSEKTWLMSIAINTCKDYRRSNWFRRVDLHATIEEIPQSLYAIEQGEKALFLDVLQLPDRYKQVILLYYYQQMTLQETADALQTSRSTVHHRLKKAERLLFQVLEGRNYDGR